MRAGKLEPDDDAVVGRGDAEVAVADGLLDGAERVAVVGLDHEQARLRDLEPGQLLQRDVGSVVLDHQLLDQGRRGPTGAHGGELTLDVLDRLLHLVDGLQQRVLGHACLRRT